MITFPNCKINLGLTVTGKRPDGFHNIETAFYPVKWQEALEIIPSKNSSLTVTGLPIESSVEDNIVWKAYQLLKSRYTLPPFHFHLHKAIPSGAGLGAGSANGAFCLQLLNKKCSLNISLNDLKELAAQLGSDCPFFLENRPVFASSRGEVFEDCKLPDLAGYFLLLVYPAIHINTKWAFEQVIIKGKNGLKEALTLPPDQWKNTIKNDFEEPVFKAHPQIQKLRDNMYENGALYASLSGSGSTVYGFFRTLPSISFPDNYTVRLIEPMQTPVSINEQRN